MVLKITSVQNHAVPLGGSIFIQFHRFRVFDHTSRITLLEDANKTETQHLCYPKIVCLLTESVDTGI